MLRRLRLPRPPSPDPDANMPLVDHLREARYRILVSGGAVIATSIISYFFVPYLLRIVLWPIEQAIAQFQLERPDGHVEMVIHGVTAGFSLYFRLTLLAGFILACPIWLYQLWRFVVPALEPRQKRVTVQFLFSAIPLFLAGVGFGYWVCVRGFAVLLQFNPPSLMNLNDVGDYLTLQMRLLLIFGLAFLLPVLLICLNRLQIVTGAGLGRFRNPAILLCAVFAAVATPTGDAITMLAVMLPMVVMYVAAELVCRLHDRRRSLSASAPTAIAVVA